MNKNDLRAWIVIIVILFIAIFLAFAGSQGGAYFLDFIPLFALGIGLIFVIQWIAFIPAYIYRTEKFFDLIGSLTYCSVIILLGFFSPNLDLRSFVIIVLVLIWAIRLGTFLFRRVLKAGEDERFRDIKQSGSRFLVTWTIQGLWVSFTLAAAMAVLTVDYREKFGIIGIIGLVIWIIGFMFEAIADYQKNQFRSLPENKGKFIQTGLWSISRHPNYFGEIVLWIGIAIIALPTLSGWNLITLISPIFVTLLLTKVSGVPLLEKRADAKWGDQEDYIAYKGNTPVLVPKIRFGKKTK